MRQGYTKRWRKRWDKGYHLDPVLWVLMSYFIDHANYRDSEVYMPNVGLIPIKKGQHIFGTLQLSVFMRIDRSLLRRKLKILENIGFLTIEATNRYSIATVINYSTYQDSDQQNDQQNGQPPTSHRPADDHQTTTPNTNKKNNTNKKLTNSHPDWLDKKLWAAFKEHRRKLRKPMTDYAEKLAIKKLEKIMNETGCSQEQIINLAIEKGWQGLFPPFNNEKPACEKYLGEN